MPAINFQRRNVAKILSGEKLTTIRRNRKRNPRPGETLYFYTGMRTKQCVKFAERICVSVRPVEVHSNHVVLEGRRITGEALLELARRDGFESWSEMKQFFEDQLGLPLENAVLIEWAPGHNRKV